MDQTWVQSRPHLQNLVAKMQAVLEMADALYARLILTVQLMSFRVENDLDPGHELRDVELPRAIFALENMLAFDQDQFAAALEY